MRKHTYWAALAVLAVSVTVFAGAATARPFAAPTIRSFAPTQGVLGSKLTIVGTNLTGAAVSFNGATPTAIGVHVNKYGDALTVLVPNDPDLMPVGSKATIGVTTADGSAQATGTFLVTALGSGKPQPNIKPKIMSVSPMKGHAGTKVTIRGNNLGGARLVEIGGIKAVYRVPSESKIIVTIPKHAHSARITLKTDGGLVSSARFIVLG